MAKNTKKPNPEVPPAAPDAVDYPDLNLDLGDFDELFREDEEILEEGSDVVAVFEDGDEEEEAPAEKPAKKLTKVTIDKMEAVKVPKLGDLACVESPSSTLLPAIVDRVGTLESALMAKLEALAGQCKLEGVAHGNQLENLYKQVKELENTLLRKLEMIDRFLSDEFGYGDNRDTILQEIHAAVIEEEEPKVAPEVKKPANGKVLDAKAREQEKTILRIVNKQKGALAWSVLVGGICNRLNLDEAEVGKILVNIGYEKNKPVTPGRFSTPE